MSERYESGQMRYEISEKKQKISVSFEDKFGRKFLSLLTLSQYLPSSIRNKYKSRRKDNRLQLKLRQHSINESGSCDDFFDHSELKGWLVSNLQLEYCYFKSLQNKSHIQRNNRFRTTCEKQVFRQLYPEIRCLVLIEEETIQPQLSQQKSLMENNQFHKGELIIYIQRSKKNTMKEVIKYLETYTAERVVYPLDDYVGITKVKREISLEQLRVIIQRLIQWLRPQLYAMAKQSRLLIKYMAAYVPTIKRQRFPNLDAQAGIQIQLQGMFQSLPQFYFSLSSIFKQHPITIGKVENIEFTNSLEQTEKQYAKQGVVIFLGSDQAIGILNLNKNFTSWVEFKRSLRKGLHIISQSKGFTRQQMQILIREHRQVEMFINSNEVFMNFVNYEYKAIDDKSFFIKCEKEEVNKFVSRAFDYLKKNDKLELRRQEFVGQFELFMFMKLVKPHIEQKYPTVSFYVQNGALFCRCKQIDTQDIAMEMSNEKRKLLKKIVRIPTVRPIPKSHYYELIEDEFETQRYCQQSNFKPISYKFNQKVDITIQPVDSLSKCHPLMIVLIDRYYEDFEFFIDQFKQNSFSLEKYQKQSLSNSTKPSKTNDRVISYSMSKSKYVNEMLVWYVELDHRDGVDVRKLRWDVDDFVDKFKNESTLQFVIPQHLWTSQRYFSTFFMQFFTRLQSQSSTSSIQQVNIFYESFNTSPKIHPILKNVFQRSLNRQLFEYRTEMRLTIEEIQKIILLQNYSLRYWNAEDAKNQSLSRLNSFIFNYEKSKNKKQFKVPLFLKPIHHISTEYLLSLKQDTYYKIQPSCQITAHKISQKPLINDFATIIQTYFRFSQYLVIYLNKQQTQIQQKRMYFWTNSSASQPNGQQRIKRFEINQQKKLIPKKNSQVDIFVKKQDIIPKYIVETHVDFLTEVKKVIFAQT